MVPQTQTPLKMLRRRQVEARVGLGCSQIYQLMQEGQFPRSVRLGARAVGWIESEIDGWLAARIAASRAGV